MRLQIRAVELFIQNLRARLPFRYGIVTMTRVPHLLVRLTLELDGRAHHGFAADHLPPKWFTKNPATAYADDLVDMLAVIRHAVAAARALPPAPTPFALWRALYAAQGDWAHAQNSPLLLAHFGTSLIERAMLDAFCRATATPFAQAARANTLGFSAAAIHPEVGALQPAHFLPSAPSLTLLVRHTVGLTDPLTEADIEPAERVHDGLPQSLTAFIETHALTRFKIKLCGDLDRDRTRLQRLAALLPPGSTFTLDGNENYRAVAPFRTLWEEISADPACARLLTSLIFVEQPFHRDIALSPATGTELRAWTARPAIIIDESDAELTALPTALAAGYAGTSHKNCKGVFKSLANAALLAHRRALDPTASLHLSAEDLSNIGPIALPQDLAVLATLGIPHAERNGHHYFAGLSQFPPALQHAAFAAHDDLYELHPDGYPMPRIRGGRMAIGTVIAAPFGLAFEPDLSGCTPLDAWSAASLLEGD